MVFDFVRRVLGITANAAQGPARKHWREEYEDAADADRLALDNIPIEQLLNRVRAGQYSDYYTLWYSIKDRATVEAAGWALFDTLNKPIDYLHRYHCAAALISLLKITHLEPVQLSGKNPNLEANIESVRLLLEKTIGRLP